MIVEKETGTRLVMVGDILHPVLNYASARLVVGASNPAIAVVSHASLSSAKRGGVIGIAGAPDAIPEASAITDSAWSVCSTVAPSGESATAVVMAGARPTGGRALGSSVLVADPGYAISDGRRSRISDPHSVPASSRRAVDAGVLGLLPDGPDVSARALPVSAPAEAGSSMCVEISAQGALSGVLVDAKITTAAHVVVPNGRGMLVRSLASTAATSSLCLLTDAGLCFPIADAAALAALGYASAPVVGMPAAVVAMLARGPVLSREAALREVRS